MAGSELEDLLFTVRTSELRPIVVMAKAFLDTDVASHTATGVSECSGSGLHLDENTTAVEHVDEEPAEGDEPDRVEQRGKRLVRQDVLYRSIE